MGMNKFLKQAKKMQEQMDSLSTEMKDALIEVEAGGGAIVINITGEGQIHSIKINPEVVDKNDIESLEDLIITGVNHAINEAKTFYDEKAKSITQGLNLPQGFNF